MYVCIAVRSGDSNVTDDSGHSGSGAPLVVIEQEVRHLSPLLLSLCPSVVGTDRSLT